MIELNYIWELHLPLPRKKQLQSLLREFRYGNSRKTKEQGLAQIDDFAGVKLEIIKDLPFSRDHVRCGIRREKPRVGDNAVQ